MQQEGSGWLTNFKGTSSWMEGRFLLWAEHLPSSAELLLTSRPVEWGQVLRGAWFRVLPEVGRSLKHQLYFITPEDIKKRAATWEMARLFNWQHVLSNFLGEGWSLGSSEAVRKTATKYKSGKFLTAGTGWHLIVDNVLDTSLQNLWNTSNQMRQHS